MSRKAESNAIRLEGSAPAARIDEREPQRGYFQEDLFRGPETGSVSTGPLDGTLTASAGARGTLPGQDGAPTVGGPAPETSALRTANRAVSAQVPEAKRAAIQAERNQLMSKKYLQGLDRREEHRLAFLEWQIDRFEDVIVGQQLDALERVADLHDQLADHISSMMNEIKGAMQTTSTGRGKRSRRRQR